MIENLKGVFETVNFKENTNLRLYLNDKQEDYPPHWHTPIEMIMPLENNYYVECSNLRMELREGDILIIAPGCLHTLTAPKSRGVRIIFQVDPTVLRGIKELEPLFSLLSPMTLFTPENSPEIYTYLKGALIGIKDEYQNNASLSEAAIYSKVLSMFVLIGRNYAKEAPRLAGTVNKHQEYAEKFMKICDYISSHCTEDLTLDAVADMAGFSKFHFSRLFKQFTNVSFYQYLSQNRIGVAEKLLAIPEYSVTAVAYNSGFTSLSSFIRMFKIVKGVTPSEFRTMYTS